MTLAKRPERRATTIMLHVCGSDGGRRDTPRRRPSLVRADGWIEAWRIAGLLICLVSAAAKAAETPTAAPRPAAQPLLVLYFDVAT